MTPTKGALWPTLTMACAEPSPKDANINTISRLLRYHYLPFLGRVVGLGVGCMRRNKKVRQPKRCEHQHYLAATPIPLPSLPGSRSWFGSRPYAMKQKEEKQKATGCAKRWTSWPRTACCLSLRGRACPASTEPGREVRSGLSGNPG